MLPSENASVLLPSNSLSPASRPRVSIAMATFNGERFVREQLESILAQSVSDFELVISDDTSTDGTWEILQEYSEKDNRIRIYRNNLNLGFKRNFEQAIRLCQADFIALSDQRRLYIFVRPRRHLVSRPPTGALRSYRTSRSVCRRCRHGRRTQPKYRGASLFC